MNYWLVKSEPTTYSWEQLQKDKKTIWDGVRNYAARNNLRAMKTGDLVMFYHSNVGKEVVGVAKVVKEAYQDPTTKEDWSVVELSPYKQLKNAVTLEQIKKEKSLKDIYLVKQGRLSVMPLKKAEFDTIVKMGGNFR
jgi:predicted RNA-binding protein with PUA-like domain